MSRTKKRAVALVGQGFCLASSKKRVLSSAAVKHWYSAAIDGVGRRRKREWNA
jgi:hypothetical protein